MGTTGLGGAMGTTGLDIADLDRLPRVSRSKRMAVERRHEFDTAIPAERAVEAAARFLASVGYTVTEQSAEHLVARKGQDRVTGMMVADVGVADVGVADVGVARRGGGRSAQRAADLPRTLAIEATEGLVSVTARVTVADPEDPMVDLVVASPLACLQLVMREGASNADAVTAYRTMNGVLEVGDRVNRRFRMIVAVSFAVAAACILAVAGLLYALWPAAPVAPARGPAAPPPAAPSSPGTSAPGPSAP